jgi:signal transduction histidine kinase
MGTKRHFGCTRGFREYDTGMSLTARGTADYGDLALSFALLMRDDMTCATLVFDSHQRLTMQSAEAARLLGSSVPFKAGTRADAFPGPVRDLLRQVAGSGTSASDTETFHRSDGPPQPLRFTALPLPGQNGDSFVVILVQDLSLAKRFEADIRQLDRLASVGTLAAEMAHELRNALVAVKTFVDLLLEQQPEAELADTVRREMKRIDSIVAQVLKYSRPSSSDFHETNLHTLLERALRLVKGRCEGRNITVVTRLAAVPDLVNGNEHHLEQAFLNLLLNATEAMTGDGTLTVETDLVADGAPHAAGKRQLRIVIRDTGAGINAEQMARLFEPFFTTKPNGTGLGLAITRRIIHEHRGVISAESEPGRGTAFQILLPSA